MERILLPRSYVCLIRRMCSTPHAPTTPTPTPNAQPPSRSMSPKYSPTNFQKFILVWTKKYKTKEDIPKLVATETIDRARSEARIKIANVLMLLTALASVGAIFSGKAAAKRGESIHQINQDFHKQYRDEYNRKEQEAAAVKQ